MMPTVLIIEDADENRQMLRTYLSKLGYQVVEAANGLEGIKAAKLHVPSAILLDLMMPVAQGDLALGFIRSTSELRHIPIIVTSAHPNAERIAEQLGANACLMKPFQLTDLRDLLESMIVTNQTS
ncbi:MAG: response regulator [Anaerolineae bacterium]|nr:response regulator [Anaerolineae bacterium]